MELLLIGGIILLIFGPKRFGLIGRSARDGLKEIKKETDESRVKENEKDQDVK
jgi:TatA/E family protein of Tat protein translocase